jgi:membrane protein
MGRTFRQHEVRRLVWILMGCAVTWQLWRWVPMVPELVAWWDVEPREPAGREAVDGWDPRVLFTPQALLPLVFYAFGLAVTLVLVRRFQRLPGFRWATVGSLQVLALMAGFATSGWQMVLGLVNVTEDGWFGNPGEFGLDQVTAPLLSCLLTGGYGRWLVTSPRRPRRGLTDQQIWAVVLVPAGLVVAAMLCAVPFSGGMTLAQVIPMLGLYCVGMWLFLHLIRALPGLRTGKLMLINCLMPALAVVQPALALLLGNVPGLGWFARLPLSVFGDVARLLSGVGVELNLGHYGLLPIAESLVVLLIYLYRLRRSAILVRR